MPLGSVQKEAGEQGDGETGIVPRLNENHLKVVGDCDPYSTSFRGRGEGAFPQQELLPSPLLLVNPYFGIPFLSAS